ncbi:MAG: glycosyltransferase family 39 protein, partial [Bdellovibrionales bacterium]|nr:glycosyltransferase family 39 protein [Bdellovibrionales bacterium]
MKFLVERSSARYWYLGSIIFIVGVFFRIYDLDVRMLHHDEGVNYFFFERIRETGYYSYSHENYHGPLFFYLHTIFMNVFGTSLMGVRFPTIFAGVLCCLTPLLLRNLLCPRGIFFSIALLSLSPSLIFHSRYAIHETMLLLSSLVGSIFLLRFLQAPTLSTSIGVSLALACAFSLKETAALLIAPVPFLILAIFDYSKVRSAFASLWGYGPPAILIGVVTLALIYTGGFQWSPGLREFVLSFYQWFQRGVGDTGHFKSAIYYPELLFRSEPSLVIGVAFSIFALAYGTWRNGFEERYRIPLFYIAWAWALLFIHSLIPYKMPWIHIQ